MFSQKEVLAKILKGMLDIVVLDLLSTKPMHGYIIMQTIRKTYGIYFGASTIYPLLNCLERKGLIEYEWAVHTEKPRKVYKITAKGKAFLAQSRRELQVLVSPLLTVQR